MDKKIADRGDPVRILHLEYTVGKNKSRTEVRDCCLSKLNRSGDLTGTHTPGTNIHMAGGTVDDCLHALDVGLPCAIGAAVRVRHSNTESNALIAELALCHPLHLLAVAYFCAYRRHFDIIAETFTKCKHNFQKNSKIF